MKNWKKVYEDSAAYRAEIVKAILEDRQMSPVLISKKDSSYQFGHFEVHVAPEFILGAIKIVEEEINFE